MNNPAMLYKMNNSDFTHLITTKGPELFRPMPWRSDTRPYYVLVSEIMLQQTQVERVLLKFNEFITRFPDIESLASAPLSDVLKVWVGLGYNRRARYLHETAKNITYLHHGKFPQTIKELMALPGIGPSTAGAIMVYTFNQPIAFIETNVRTVYFHHFFRNTPTISDKDILPILKDTIDEKNPRAFYWALMDYGTFLKKQGHGNTQKSKHYKKQPPLKGSVREIRGQIIAILSQRALTYDELRSKITNTDLFEPALNGLIRENLIQKHKNYYRLAY